MDNATCYIFGAGEFEPCPIELTSRDLVIAADGGYDYLVEMGLRADIVLGDFDSITSFDVWDDTNCEKLTYPPEKDDTDMLLAIKLGISRGYESFAIYGGLGGRMDHSISNIQALTYIARQGVNGVLYHHNHAMTVINNSSYIIPKETKGYVSIFSLSDVSENVTIKGLKYDIYGENITNDFPIGTSNEAIGKKGFISVGNGTLLIMWQIDSEE
ncbi:MAG: thiamine diphosphokinase [Eubacterium sp.]|nr:thiamine diphosphokinase [Eubacterium sp.]